MTKRDEAEVPRRFSARVDDYVRYRPSYPVELVRTLEHEVSIAAEATRVVDLGCGTGISSALFLEQGYNVTGVEPSTAMREAAMAQLGGYPRFSVIAGEAEHVPLRSACCELIVAAQAFHWFELDASRAEMKRLLVDGGVVALFWNVRRVGSTAFLTAYESVMREHLPEYAQRAAAPGDVSRLFSAKGYQRREFENHQLVDLDGMLGRSMSSSYFPRPGEPEYERLVQTLTELFGVHAVGGQVTLEQDTTLFFGQLD